MSKKIPYLIFLLILLIFCYFRLKPIYFQTVAYTYDQGRDFKTAAEIVMNAKPKLTGPTTGIPGLFHGVWWYYLLIIPFVLFKGNPAGFYFFVFLIQLASFLVFFFFIKKNFDRVTTFITALIVASSPYFISTSSVISNNVMAAPSLLAFLILNFNLLKNKIKNIDKTLFFLGLSLGFLAEFELAFGIIAIPGYAFLVLIWKDLKKYFSTLKRNLIFLAGLAIPFIPRMIFELIRGFPQTRALFSFVIKPKLNTPKQYGSVLQDRLNLFFDYFQRLFLNEGLLFTFTVGITLIIILILIAKNVKNDKTSLLKFFLIFNILLFVFSTFYRDSFWSNYFEGIQYLFIFTFALLLSLKIKNYQKVLDSVKIVIFVLSFSLILNTVRTDFAQKPKHEGLREHADIVKYIHSNENDLKNYCVNIYTPPVIPHTYDYLFLYSSFSKKVAKPKDRFSNRRCWYIIEKDGEEQLRFDWRNANIPKKAKMTKQNIFTSAYVELWEK